MQVLLAWVLTLFTNIPGRVLAALGFGFLTFTGYSAIVDQLVSASISSVSSIPGSVYNILALTGFVDAFGIILGAIVARSALLSIDQFAKLS